MRAVAGSGAPVSVPFHVHGAMLARVELREALHLPGGWVTKDQEATVTRGCPDGGDNGAAVESIGGEGNVLRVEDCVTGVRDGSCVSHQ